ncbi:unnamed protein product [Phaeothamnion confervicola]
MSLAPSEITVMMNGLPGNMGREVAAACLRKGFKVAPYALTGPDVEEDKVEVDNMEGGPKTSVKLIKATDGGTADGIIQGVKAGCGNGLVVIDYTHPSAVNGNAEFYARNGLNFVMGTTGGDREKLMATTVESGVYAVIAPNMGKQIVALQATIELMAKQFPGAFSGYMLEVTESHQSAKADVSGTGKALAADLAVLAGSDFPPERIKMLRQRDEQLAFGVPEDALRGHAFHTYSLKSGDGSVEFQFRHNVCGRRTYAEGTADAVAFLAGRAAAKAEQRVYNMVDVLRLGGV